MVKPGYKQTEIGVIPADWEVKAASEICELVVDCKNRTPPVIEGGEFAVVRTPNVRNGKFVRDELRFTDEQSYYDWTARAIPQIGDVLITREAPLGEVCLVPSDLKVCLGQRMMLYRPDTEKMKSHFLLYALMASEVQKNLLKKIGGSTVGHARVDDIRELKIPVPPRLAEQEAIAEALADVDGLIVGLDRLIAKKRDVKTAVMQQLLTGKKRLPGFNGEWQPINIGKHATLKARIGWQGLTTGEYLESGSFYLVTGTDFANGRVNWETCHFVDEWRYTQDRNIQLKEEDILITKDGTIGKIGYVDTLPKPATLNSGVFVIRPLSEAFEPIFLYYILTSRIFEGFLSKLSAGSTISHLYQKDFVYFEFLAPMPEEQKAIGRMLSDMDAEITALEARRAKTQAIKQGMMQELLTGRTRLL